MTCIYTKFVVPLLLMLTQNGILNNPLTQNGILYDKRSFATLVNLSMLDEGDDPTKVVSLTNTTVARAMTE